MPPDEDDDGSVSMSQRASRFLSTFSYQDSAGEDWRTLHHWNSSWWWWSSKRGSYQRLSDHQVENRYVKWAQAHRMGGLSGHSITDTLRLVRAACELDVGGMPCWIDQEGHERSSDVDWMATAGGLIKPEALSRGVHQHTQELSPAWFSSVCLPWTYDPEASCPLWEEVLANVLGDDRESYDLVQEWAGYLCIGRILHERILLLVGDGQTGKSTIARVLSLLVGEMNTSSCTLTEMASQYGLSKLVGKQLNLVTEASGVSSVVAENHLKALASGESVGIHQKYKDPFDIRWTGRIILVTNEYPKFKDQSGALYRRLCVLPTTRVIQSPQYDIHERLRGEIPGVFNWALRGLRRLLERGAFTVCSAGEGVATSLRKVRGGPGAFLRAHLIASDEGWVSDAELYTAYDRWCSEEAQKPALDSPELFSLAVNLMGATTEKRNSGGFIRSGLRGFSLSRLTAAGS